MPEYLDVESWHRRDLYNFFRNYQNPYFNVCTRIEITKLIEAARARKDGGLSLAYHYFALRAANETKPFHYRLENDRIVIYEVINGGTTVLLPNETFTYAYFNYYPEFDRFMSEASAAIEKVRAEGSLKPTMRYDLIFFTTLPWISFTSFAHARTPGRGESIPRIAFGKFIKEGERTFLPISVEVHHALMDGLHVGRFMMRLDEMLANPQQYLG
ncbi:MAG TPA: CatA-like O-acetyltransferase [Pyrinomonadaceae bacterium]|nr:CatA-like O-acetyltransferase [Pyrinomonadaceae bacterium]